MAKPPTLPVDAVLPALSAALAAEGRAVLQAPPGAGKTTRVPLSLAETAGIEGKILMLEPRRVAARAAAERLAEHWGERPGARIGYRMRGESRAGQRIEVVTEGILTRMLQHDPGLEGVGCVIFDEFHERSLQADLGLALCLEVRGALREDLALVVMSATLDAAPVAALMGDAPIITSDGRTFPVETRWLDRPTKAMRGPAFAEAVAALTRRALEETEGGVLVFLPGVGEIAQVADRLRPWLTPATVLLPLHGRLPFQEQRRAILPLPQGRKLVLATAIAETSLTLDGIRVVVDGGRARRARHDPGKGMARLVTERVTRAEADQRRGRAGRVAPGICYRLWTKGEESGMRPFPPPEIAAADLAPLALELAAWGAADPSALAFLTPPPETALAEARALLTRLGALDPEGRITAHGRRLQALPTHPRLAHMVETAESDLAAELAGLLDGADLIQGSGRVPVDLTLRLEALRDIKGFEARRPQKVARAAQATARETAARLAPENTASALSPGATLSLAFPDRIALRRPGEAPRYLLSGGAGAVLDEADPLAGQRMLIAADLDGDRREARIRLALPVTEAEIKALHAAHLAKVDHAAWSKRARRVEARQRVMLGALILEDRIWRNPPEAATVPALIDGIRALGLERLPWSPAALRLRGRVAWLRASGSDLPDWSDAALAADLEGWLGPHLGGILTLEGAERLDLGAILEAGLDWEARQRLEREAPAAFEAPTGTRVPVDYSAPQPAIAIRLQELFGLTTHPTIGPRATPLQLTLLSPAGRPVQTTADLPGFWARSYGDVRKDMRGRYPKHPWPEDPTTAAPTRRAKPRGK